MVATDRRRFLELSGATACVGVTGLSGCLHGGGGGSSTLGLNFIVPLGNSSSVFDIPEIQEQATNLGDVYEIDITQDDGTPRSVNQLAAGQTDIVLLSSVSMATSYAEDAVPGGVTMVAMDFWDAYEDYFGFTVFSGPDSDITETQDLDGATIGVNALGTGTHANLNKGLIEAGLDPENDVEYVEQPMPTFVSAIKDGVFDAALFPAIFSVQARAEAFTEVFSSHDAWGEGYPFAYVVVGNDSLDSKEDEVEAFVEDYVEIVDYMFENRSEVVSLAAEHFELPEQLIDGYWLTKNDFYREDVSVDTDALQRHMDGLVDLGFLDNSIDVTEFATNDYLP